MPQIWGIDIRNITRPVLGKDIRNITRPVFSGDQPGKLANVLYSTGTLLNDVLEVIIPRFSVIVADNNYLNLKKKCKYMYKPDENMKRWLSPGYISA